MPKIPAEADKRISTSFQQRIVSLIQDSDCKKSEFAAETLSCAVIVNSGKGFFRNGNLNGELFSRICFYSLKSAQTNIWNGIFAIILNVKLYYFLNAAQSPVFDRNKSRTVFIFYFGANNF